MRRKPRRKKHSALADIDSNDAGGISAAKKRVVDFRTGPSKKRCSMCSAGNEDPFAEIYGNRFEDLRARSRGDSRAACKRNSNRPRIRCERKCTYDA